MAGRGFRLVRVAAGRPVLVVGALTFLVLSIEASAVLAGGGWSGLGRSSAHGPVPRAPRAVTRARTRGTMVGHSYKNDRLPALRNARPTAAKWSPEHEANPNPRPAARHVDAPDGALQTRRFAPNMPSPLKNLDGIPYPGVGCRCAPPDTNGEVGLTQYVQIVNEGIQVWDKLTETSLLGPVGITSLWAGFGGVCENNGDGDPVVLYDQLANRWLISQFAGSDVPTDECIAVSTTSDATGSWNRYGFHLGSDFFDYPHLGVWPDAYYMTMNVFGSSSFLGPQPFAFDRAAMLAGNPATFITTRDPAVFDGANDAMLPADLDGSTLPAPGAPEPFLMSGEAATWKLWRFHADFATPANSTFTLGGDLTPAGYTEICPSTPDCVPQLGTAAGLDALGDRGMFRLAYRNFGDHEALVGNQTVSSGGVAGIRWYEIGNATSGTPAFAQQSTYQPDTTWRWMGSAAMDRDGDLAVGFSASSAAIHPQIRYAGRLASDPVNTLAQGEAHLFDGTGSQTALPLDHYRWGDYSDLTVDPFDDCTFWYTQEYYGTTGNFNWRTRIGTFKFPSCNPPGAAVAIAKVADAGVVKAGEQAGFTVWLENAGSAAATGLATTDVLPGGAGINWTIDAANSDSGWSITGSAPNQSLVYEPTTLAAHASTLVHLVTSTTAGTCGLTLSNTASYTTANAGSGSASAAIRVVAVPTLREGFDNVAAPTLPAGWSAANTAGPPPTWRTSSSGDPAPAADSAPNSASVDEPDVVSDKRLTSPSIGITSTEAQVSFRQNRDLEVGDDGGVLEISIAGAAFQDILAAGGSFASGAYNGTLSNCCSNPLANRQAWTGTSGGFLTTTVNLPAAAAGHSIRLRWRLGTDDDLGGGGWRIDNVVVTESCPVTITKTADAASVAPGDQIGYTVTLSNPRSSGVSNLSLTDNLPAGNGINWTLDGAGSSSGWSVSGSAPHQSLSYAPAGLAAGASTHVHVVSTTSGSSCGTYSNTASFVSPNGGSGSASASTTVRCWALTVHKAGAGSGAVASSPAGISCGTACSALFQGGTQITLTATAATGSSFTGWSGGGCAGTGPCSFVIGASKTVTANFALQSRSLQVRRTGNGRGKVISVPGGIACPVSCSAMFAYGTSVKLTAEPSTTSVFAGWSGACSGKATCALSMTEDRSATATFRAKCVVPRLLGLMLRRAKARIRRAHCTVGKITREASAKSRRGKVLAQKPRPGTKLAPGGRVNLVVGRA